MCSVEVTGVEDVQIERRRQRALEEGFKVRNTGGEPVFSTYTVLSPSGRVYEVTVRSLQRRINGCTCPDFLTNQLGSCKHIEAVLAALDRKLKGKLAEAERAAPPTAEVYLSYGEQVEVCVEAARRLPRKAAELIGRYFDDRGRLTGDPAVQVRALVDEASRLPAAAFETVRVAPDVVAYGQMLADGAAHRAQRDWFLGEVRAGRRSLDVVGTQLYPYQVEGMLHLAFNGRALLADDMGLGKTVQAIAAALLLRELRGISRVLIVTPASLKHQWQREIRRFTGLPAQSVDGPASKRELLYATPAFFTLVNYELLLRDREVFERLAPDLMILDEAQRVKNWRTQTAQAVKSLSSRYRFVLTGTPLENNLDELYSVMQTLDPRLLGPLWRFNARYFQTERRKSGTYKVLGYKNLEELRTRIRPVVLRRTRDEVLTDLPPRVDNNIFAEMTPAQLGPYDEYKAIVAKLVRITEYRPLTPDESKRLFMALQKMRILCDALELHDRRIPAKLKRTTAPKLDELANILREQVREGRRKAVLFSSFEGMLDLAIERVARPLKLGHVKLAGSVPTARRGALLDRFRDDPECRLFFSTDAGGVGLNLQSASLVINLDLPWNPAVLEQRIGRAHRMGQSQTVQVVNLIAQGTIEERMLDTLAQKRQIFQAVFAAMDGPDELVFAKDRGLIARLRQLLTDEPVAPELAEAPAADAAPAPEPVKLFAERLAARLGTRLMLVRRMSRLAGAPDLPRVLVVVDRGAAELTATLEEVAASVADPAPFSLHVFDRAGYAGLAGLLGPALAAEPESYRSPALPADAAPASDAIARARAARADLERAAERLKLARLMAGGGFAGDAVAPLRQALDHTLDGLYRLAGDGTTPDRTSAIALEKWLVRSGILTSGDSARVPWIVSALEPRTEGLDRPLVESVVDSVEKLAEAGRVRITATEM